VSTGIAKPTPADAPDALMMNVLTPISRPAESSSGPPELPAQRSAWFPSGTHSLRSGQRRGNPNKGMGQLLRPRGLPAQIA
jgi:hypothetical protein